MFCKFLPMTEEYEDLIIGWRSEFRYSCYDLNNNKTSLDELFDSDDFDSFVALSEDEEVIGFLECHFSDDSLKVGIGLVEDYMGRGIGFDFIVSSLEFIQDYYDYTGDTIQTVLRREDAHSVKVFERVGFSIIDENDEYVELEIDA